jgi:putative membrane protein
MRFVYWGLTALIAILCAVFAVYNREPAVLDFWPFPAFELPLFLAVLGPLVIGLAVGWLAAWFGHFGTRRERRRLARHAERLEAELARAKEPPPGRSLAT